ncbi:MAG: hypothetical protein WDN00_12925 [Limisphaerales bacterium]
MVLADYSLWENMQMLAPKPKRYKFEMTVQVERVVQGEFDAQSICIRWLHTPTQQQRETLGIANLVRFPFTNGMPLRVGFDSCTDQHLQNFKLMVLHE